MSSSSSQRFIEKPNFSLTCNLLSRYLKEKGNFGYLNYEIARNSGKIESHGDETPVASPRLKSMDLFPQQTGFGPTEEVVNDKVVKSAESEAAAVAPLTIFYAGQVLVFENIPAEKAQEIMVVAAKGTSTGFAANDKGIGSGATTSATSNSTSRSLDIDLNKVTTFDGSSYSSSSAGLGSKPECSKRRSLHRVNASDLPIARRASLHRFLEKRKDRVGERAPYQLMSSSNSAAAKAEESKSWNWPWLGLAN
ncbi:hypothetical protein Sjap_019657 [Stephania japonica]|uniref:Protein TIFY n=1 Tax=Stephania japonica TaxID=461633 RepID=A0AAP0HUX5_9MAGN